MSHIIRDRNDLAEFCERERQLGYQIVFTNGVFDLFHAGHLDSLNRAKAEGDLLIVGVNSDESVKRLKGPGRPVLPLDQRLRVLAALECVGAVVPFDEDTPANLIEIVKPDVLVKGGHYTVEQIVGHESVLARGGRVLSLPLVQGRSTTDIIGTIKSRFM
ncbi:D-glycero-beta-D-manno-heptose 1-phosphate adenylyltransferase [bacterium]|nr:D-glycero-beta-D-manno-heptose 1-phosphate adenylyltransferase [bacterium]